MRIVFEFCNILRCDLLLHHSRNHYHKVVKIQSREANCCLYTGYCNVGSAWLDFAG